MGLTPPSISWLCNFGQISVPLRASTPGRDRLMGSSILGENRDISFLFLDPRNKHVLVKSPGPLPTGQEKDVLGSGICNGSCSTLGMREAGL